MTVIAVKVEDDKIIIGADTQITKGWSKRKEKGVKLFEVHDMVVGHTGLCLTAGLFRVFATTTKPKSSEEYDIILFMTEFGEYLKDKDQTNDSQFLLVMDKKVFYVNHLFVQEVKTYYAIGSGEDFASSALYLGNSVKEAIKAACHLSIYCEEPIVIMEVDK